MEYKVWSWVRVGRVRASRRRGRHYASGTVGVRRAHLSITAAFLSTRIISQQQQTMRILIWNLFAIHLIRRTCGVIALLRFVSVCLCNVSWYFTTYYSRRLRACVVKLCGYFWSYASAHFPSAPALSVSNSRRAHGHNSQYAFL